MKYLLVVLFFCIIGSNLIAQENKTAAPATKNLQFHSINQAGLLEGESGSAFQLQTINGLGYRSWFTGIGVGLDYYRLRSIPLFLDLRKEFGRSAGRFFVYAEGGIDFAWATDKQKNDYLDYPYYQSNSFQNGPYAAAGIGYKLIFTRNLALVISPGFSYKKKELKSSNTSNTYCPVNGPPCVASEDRYDYNFYRFSLNLGLVF